MESPQGVAKPQGAVNSPSGVGNPKKQTPVLERARKSAKGLMDKVRLRSYGRMNTATTNLVAQFSRPAL